MMAPDGKEFALVLGCCPATSCDAVHTCMHVHMSRRCSCV